MLSIKRLLFLWVSSAAIALGGYYLLQMLVPTSAVFSSLYRMPSYHRQYPYDYIALVCFIFGTVATWLLSGLRAVTPKKIASVCAIMLLLTLLIASAFGGMLWHYHDMRAGFFPDDWPKILLIRGVVLGLQYGWLIWLLSFPYNILGTVVCCWLVIRAAKKLL